MLPLRCRLAIAVQSGLILCLSPSLLVFASHFSLLFPGLADPLRPFWKWRGNCQACGRIRKGTNGLFCGNFGYRRGGGKRFVKRFDVGIVTSPTHLTVFTSTHLLTRLDMNGWSTKGTRSASRWPEMETTSSHLFSVTGACSAC